MPKRSAAQRVTLVLDIASCLAAIALFVGLQVALLSPVLPTALIVVFGIWAGVISTLAAPAVVVLHLSPPRVRLAQRSALFASAVWFVRFVGSGVVFALSIVLGAVAGVVAARTSDSQHGLAAALGMAFSATATLVLWPTLALVVALAYVVMGIRWLADLGAIAEAGGGNQAWTRVRQRWGFVGVGGSEALTYVLVAVVGRSALFLALVTAAVDLCISGVALSQP